MSAIHVCPLSQVPALFAGSGAGWVVSVLAAQDRVPAFGGIAADRHLHLALSDITEPKPDFVLAQRSHIDALLGFVGRWDRATPLLIHCYAGVSRSTAAAFVALCALLPTIPEVEHARRLRTASPTATPNPRVVAVADAVLGRDGRMAEAIAAIGRGRDCYEGVPFALPVGEGGPDGSRP